ncbi:MAG: M48 family metallopeptidase [Betaproteobacteria bacterium]|nr:M48 family metallopeptidase [Betaproteobacteria bacterium]
MRFVACLLACLLAFLPQALAQSQLPDLGDATASDLPLQTERRIGEAVVRDIRLREPTYLDDPEIADYLNQLGAKLAAAVPGLRQDFEFFALRDASINAFALPGGFIGVHTGLISATDNESELASVLGHEMGHVTQRHIARQMGMQKQMQLPMMVAMAAAILLGRSRPDLAGGAAIAAQGGAVQSQLSYSRDFEREADRIGFQTLAGSGFDVRAMGTFFEKMQRHARVMDDGTFPGYLRTHPLTTERITDAESRAAALPYRQRADSLEFHLVRAKVRAEAADAREAVKIFSAAVSDRRFANEPGARYGFATALLRVNEPKRAEAELARLRAAGVANSMIETLAARIRIALGDRAGALALLKAARTRYPHRRPVLYATLESLHEMGRDDEVLATLAEPLRLYPRDARLHEARAKAYAGQGKRLLQHQAQAEVYVLQGSLPAAIEQLQLAQGSGEGNFYELSVVEARLKELRAEHALELQDARKR